MVVGSRVDDGADARPTGPATGFGNALLTGAVAKLFGGRLTDMLSGYRVFSRRYAKSFPALSKGFEIETELTVHALELRMAFAEVPAALSARGPKARRASCRPTATAGASCRPSQAASSASGRCSSSGASPAVLVLLSLAAGRAAGGHDFLRTGLVPRFPTAVLVTGSMLVAMLSLRLRHGDARGHHRPPGGQADALPGDSGRALHARRDHEARAPVHLLRGGRHGRPGASTSACCTCCSRTFGWYGGAGRCRSWRRSPPPGR